MHHLKNFFFTVCLALFMPGCGSYQIESDETTDEKATGQTTEYMLTLRMESESNAKINFPISIFIFNAENDCIHAQNTYSTEEDYGIRLPKGKYNVVVLSGLEGSGLSYPLQFTPQSYISLPAGLHASIPLQGGKASISLNQSTTAHISLSYFVSAMHFSLNGIPAEAQAVEIRMSPVSSAVTFEGDYKNDLREATFSCHREGLRWVSEENYVFPCTSMQTRITIDVTLPGKTEAYGYTYPATLKPGCPYHFNGKYADAVTLDGTYQSKGWQQVTEIEFGFDNITTDTPSEPAPPTSGTTGSEEDGTTTLTVDKLPQAGELWKECLVTHVEKESDTRCWAVIVANDYMLLTADGVQSYLAGFSFGGLTRWRTFTTEEAAAFRDSYYGANGVSALNSFLLDNDVSPFKYDTGDRYFCNNGKSSFCFTSQTIATVGEKKSYYIRPVKTVVFSTNQL